MSTYDGWVRSGNARFAHDDTLWIQRWGTFDPFVWLGDCAKLDEGTEVLGDVSVTARRDPRGGLRRHSVLAGAPAESTDTLIFKRLEDDKKKTALKTCWWNLDQRMMCGGVDADAWNSWDEIIRRCSEQPVATKEVLSAIRDADAIIIGPSNPVTSISPILECGGIRDALKDQFVIVISPFIGDAPVSGPAAELMMAWDMAPNGQATYDLYRDFTDVFVQDIRDPAPIDGAIRLDTLMTDIVAAERLAESIQQIIDTENDRRHA